MPASTVLVRGGLKRRPGWDAAELRFDLSTVTPPVKDGLNRRPGCFLLGFVPTCDLVPVARGGLSPRPGLVAAGLRADVPTVAVPVKDGLNRRPG
ncbi:hypothetical protein ACFU5N_15790 [Streptomyces albidoflavus]